MDAVKMLVDHDADPLRRSKDGKTPLESAAEENHQAVVEYLTRVADEKGLQAHPVRTGALANAPEARMAGLDFSDGVVIEGELRKKRANRVVKWRKKYYVLSSKHEALFFWTGDRDHVEGVIKKIRYETFLRVRQYPEKQGGKRLDVQVLTGRTMQLLAPSQQVAQEWVSALRNEVGHCMAAVRIQTAWRMHSAYKRLKRMRKDRETAVKRAVGSGSGAAGGNAAAGDKPLTGSHRILMEGSLKKKNSKISASFLSAYRTRYFVLDLDEASLLYYDSKAKRNLGVHPRSIPLVSLFSVEAVRDARGNYSRRFYVGVVSGRNFMFEAPSAAEAEKWVHALEQVLPRDNIAAVQIQSAMRGFLARRKVKRLREAQAGRKAELLQSLGISQREGDRAATGIQAWFRMRRARRAFVQRQERRRLVERRAQAISKSRMYLRQARKQTEAPPRPPAGSAQEKRMTRLMRLKQLREKKKQKAKESAGGGPVPAAEERPDPWEQHVDPDSGRPFWHNTESGETTWTDPHAKRYGPWVELLDPGTGNMYYVNEETGESRWEMPEEVRVARLSEKKKHVQKKPPTWVAQEDDSSGMVFYANRITGETQWEMPEHFENQFVAPSEGGEGCARWVVAHDAETSLPFYQNAITGVVQWEKPSDYDGEATLEVEEEGADPYADWIELRDPDSGRPYYYNTVTEERTWTHPRDQARDKPRGASATPEGSRQADVPQTSCDRDEVFALSMWINEHLDAEAAEGGDLAGVLPLDAESDPPALFSAARNGILLAKMVNVVAVDAVDERALTKNAAPGQVVSSGGGEDGAADEGEAFFFMNAESNPALENCQLAISAAQSAGAIRGREVNPMDLEAGRPGAVVQFFMSLWRKQLADLVSVRECPSAVVLLNKEDDEELNDLLLMRPEDLLVRWMNYQLHLANFPARMNEFGSDLSDGKLLAAVLSVVAPGHATALPSSKEAMDAVEPSELVERVLSTGFAVGVPRWFRVTSITSGNKQLQSAFVAFLWQFVPHMEDDTVEQARALGRRATMSAREVRQVQGDLAELRKTEAGEDESLGREGRMLQQWINSLNLKGDVYVRDLTHDLSDGLVLLQVLDAIEPGIVRWKKANKKCHNRYKAVENCNYVVEVCGALEFSLVNVSGLDIVDGNPKMIASLTFQMMRHHTLKVLSSVAFSGFEVDESQVLEWANEKVAASTGDSSARIAHFHDPSLSNSVYLLHVLNQVRPVVNWDVVLPGNSPEEKETNAKYLLSVARRIGAAVFCTWEDIVDVRSRIISTFLASVLVCERKMAAGRARDFSAFHGDDADDEDDGSDSDNGVVATMVNEPAEADDGFSSDGDDDAAAGAGAVIDVGGNDSDDEGEEA